MAKAKHLTEADSSSENESDKASSSTTSDNDSTSDSGIYTSSCSDIERLKEFYRKALNKGDNSKVNILQDKIVHHLCDDHENKVDFGDYEGAIEVYSELKGHYGNDVDEILKNDYIFPRNASALHMAVINNNPIKVAEILERDISELWSRTEIDTDSESDDDVVPDNPYNATPLHFAAYYGYEEVVEILLLNAEEKLPPHQFQEYLNEKDYYQRSAIYFAVLEKNSKINSLLYRPEINLSCDKNIGTLFHMAINRDDGELLRELIDFDIRRHKQESIECAAYLKTRERFNFCQISAINILDGKGRTAFHYACKKGDVEAAKILLQHPSININIEDYKGITPISYAIRKQSSALLKEVRKKVSANSKIYQSGKKKAIHNEKAKILEEDYIDIPVDLDRDFLSSEAVADAIKDMVVDEIVKLEMEQGALAIRDDENEGLTYLHEALKTKNWNVLIEVLRFVELDLEKRDDLQRLRAITLAKAEMRSDITKEEYRRLKRLKNDIVANLRSRSLKELKARLSKYTIADLKILLRLANTKISGKSLLSGYINFAVYIQVNKGKRKTSAPITENKLIEIIKEIIDEQKRNIKNGKESLLTKTSVLTYITLEAAHGVFNESNCTSGEELDSKDEIESLNLRKAIWHEETRHENTKVIKEEELAQHVSIPIFRGINFMLDLFEHKDRYIYEKQAYKTPYFASHGCYYLLKKEPHDQTVTLKELQAKGEDIKQKIRLLADPSTKELFVDSEKALRGCSSLLRRLQVLYTENINGFNFDVFANLVNAKPAVKKRINEKFPWFEELFTRNPFVSGSIIPMHSIRYALGVSRASANTELLLDPRYDKTGKPKYPCVGMVFISLYPKEEYQQLEAINVPKAFAQGEFMLKGYLELLAEAEITIAGMMEHIVVGMPIIFPSFEDNCRVATLSQFNLSEKLFDRIAIGLKNKRGTEEHRVAITELKEHLIQYYDAKLLSIAEHQAKLRKERLEFELPNGRFISSAPTPSQVRNMAAALSPRVKDSFKSKLKALKTKLKSAKKSELRATFKEKIKRKKKYYTEITSSLRNSLISNSQVTNKRKSLADSHEISKKRVCKTTVSTKKSEHQYSNAGLLSKFSVLNKKSAIQVFTGFIPYGEQAYFKEVPNNGFDSQGRPGSCGYLSLNANREQVINSLMANLNNQNLREYIGDQIRNDFQDPTANTYLNLSTEFYKKLNQLMSHYSSEQEYHNHIIMKYNTIAGLKDPSIDELIKYFDNDKKIIEKLNYTKEALSQADKHLKAFIVDKDLIKNYIEKNLSHEWLGAYVALAWAEVNNKKLRIWAHNDGNMSSIYLRNRNSVSPNVVSVEAIDILHTNNNSHYVRLLPISNTEYHSLSSAIVQTVNTHEFDRSKEIIKSPTKIIS